MKWSKIRIVRFEKEKPFHMKFKYDLQESEFTVATIGREVEKKQTRKRLGSMNSNSIVLKNIHHAPLAITGKKKKGLVKLCTSKPPSIPAPFHSFYAALLATDGPIAADDDFNDSDHDDLND